MKHLISVRTLAVIASFGAAGLLLSVQSPQSNQSTILLRDPETEVAAAKTKLDNLISRLNSSEAIYARPGLGPQTYHAERAFAAANRYFENKEWLSTIRELNNFLNQTQVPKQDTYLQSQYMLGRSYEELGYKSKSLRAYFRYLAGFLTAKAQNHDELLDVLRRMIPLAASDELADGQVNQLIASLTNIELPEVIRPDVFYISAKAIANHGHPRLADKFLDTAITSSKNSSLRARSFYMQALLALTARDFTKAEEALSDALQEAGDSDQTTRDLARLALARIAIHRKKPDTALKYYNLLDEDSTGYRSALFESIYVHLRLNQDKEARGKALQFLALYGNNDHNAEVFQLRTLLAYLDLRASDTEAALKSIAAADGQLADIGTYLRQNLSAKSTITQTELIDFLTLSKGQVEPIPSLRRGYKLFSRLAEIKRRLADSRGEIRDMLFTIGRLELQRLRPHWTNRAESLALIADEILQVGHRLIATERHLYRDRLDEVDWQALTASERRRTLLLTPLAAQKRRHESWALQLNFIDVTQDIAVQHQQLNKSKAELAASRYLLSTNLKTNDTTTRNTRLEELKARSSILADQLARALELVRSRKIEALLSQSPHRAERKLMTQYASALTEELTIISRARQQAKTEAETLLASDATATWNKWEFAAKKLFSQLSNLDDDMSRGIKEILTELDHHEQKHQELQDRLHATVAQLESQMGMSIGYIVDQYISAIDSQLSRHQKWRADIEWLTYQGKLQEQQRLDDRYRLEQQILKDQLTDFKQGVTWQWPN